MFPWLGSSPWRSSASSRVISVEGAVEGAPLARGSVCVGGGRVVDADDGRTASASCASGLEEEEAPAVPDGVLRVGAQREVVVRSRSDIVEGGDGCCCRGRARCGCEMKVLRGSSHPNRFHFLVSTIGEIF